MKSHTHHYSCRTSLIALLGVALVFFAGSDLALAAADTPLLASGSVKLKINKDKVMLGPVKAENTKDYPTKPQQEVRTLK